MERWAAGPQATRPNRQLVGGELVCSLSVDSTRVIEVLEMWFSVRGQDNLNEVNAMEIVHTNADGAGSGMVVEMAEPGGSGNDGVSGVYVGNAGWGTEPTVARQLGGAHPFNLAYGWRWPARELAGSITIEGVNGIGFRLVDTLSATMNWHFGILYRKIGD